MGGPTKGFQLASLKESEPTKGFQLAAREKGCLKRLTQEGGRKGLGVLTGLVGLCLASQTREVTFQIFTSWQVEHCWVPFKMAKGKLVLFSR